jgi:tRNA pseudouridine55 synthase
MHASIFRKLDAWVHKPPICCLLRCCLPPHQVGGQKLYEAARKGQEVERQPRTVTVECFDLQRDATDAQSVHFRVVCSKGTYIRSLAHDLGAALGSAAHLTALRRDAIGTHSVVGAWDVQQLAQQLYAQRDERNEQQAKQEQQALEQEQEQAAATAAEDGDGLTPS